jgi:hypothetical protein
VVYPVDHGVDHLQRVHVADEPARLLAQLSERGRLGDRGEREQEAPAMRLAHEDHPLVRVGEIGEVGIVAWVGDIEIHHDVDQHIGHIVRDALDRDAELGTDGSSAAAGSAGRRRFPPR